VERVARAVLVGGWPAADGGPVMEGFDTLGGDLPMPPWSKFSADDLKDLDDAGLADFRARAVPSPASYTTDPVRLTDERRYGVPVTAICPEYSADDLRDWLESGEDALAELARIHSVELVDVSTGHWPQLTRPQELSAALVAAATSG
jgi:pimeloyl-ACP methyl ester carboxylesterase